MAHLLSFTDTRPQFEIANPSAPADPPAPSGPSAPPLLPQSIKAATKTALVVANESLVKVLRRCFEEEGYTIRIASNTEEGMRLYSDFAPFNVVIIEYDAPERDGVQIDVFLPQTSGRELASDILKINSSQGIIFSASPYRNRDDLLLPQELLHIPVMIDITILQLRTLLSTLEVRRAMAALTIADKLRLKRAAEFWFQVRGLTAHEGTADELLSEAQFLTLIGAEDTQQGRHWNRDVDLVWHLSEAMRSISTNWKRQSENEEKHFRLEPLDLPTRDAEGREKSPLKYLPSPEARADRILLAKERVAQIFRMFTEDTEATQVLQGWYDGLKPNEIRQKYGLDEKQFAAAKKRIRVETMSRRNGGGEEHGI
jgi:CheY-like chemotaxis protein